MGALPGSHEIMEWTEKYDSEYEMSQNTGKQHAGKPLKTYTVEDDINKLFEAIEVRSSHRGVRQSERAVRDASHKSSMKRPMRPGPSQVSGIGISESVSLKQALRGLCISQASELAAVKKRMPRPSASSRISEAVAIKGFYRAVVIEASESGQLLDAAGKGNLVEISLVPEKSTSNGSDKMLDSEHCSMVGMSEGSAHPAVPSVDASTHNAKMIKMITKEVMPPVSPNAVRGPSKAEPEQNRTSELSFSSISTILEKKQPLLDEVSPISDKGSITARAEHKERDNKLESKSFSLISGVGRKLTKSSSKALDLSKRSLRSQNLVKKKIVQKTTFVSKNLSQQNQGANNHHHHHASKMVCHTPDCVVDKDSEEPEKVSPASSSTADLVIDSIAVDSNTSNHVLRPHSFSKTKSLAPKADESSESREKGISETSKSSIGEYSSTSYSEESCLSRSGHSGYHRHMSKDLRWRAIHCVQKQHGRLGMKHLKLLRKLGDGEIGTVYLSELIDTSCLFAVKVMDNDISTSRKKMLRAQTEKEILEILDHPFLPTLYTHFTADQFTCLVMDYCPGGDLHVLRQKQPTKSFPEQAARFYVAEVLLALEYLHMLGVVYRDLKPENILVGEDGHIMLSDFDLSLRCPTNPVVLKSSPVAEPSKKMPTPCSESSCIDPFCLHPSWQLSCFTPKFLSAAAKTGKLKSELAAQVIPLPQLVVEPTSARSNSFVGTHEYLAPEIIKGEGHGSAVDWWAIGILLYELLYGRTPFKGSSNEDTVSNVVSQCLTFPQCPIVSSHARDLIRRLLQKEPESRLGSCMGAAEIKQHSFFEGLNWALIRCETPPELPKVFDLGSSAPDPTCQNEFSKCMAEVGHGADDTEFEMF